MLAGAVSQQPAGQNRHGNDHLGGGAMYKASVMRYRWISPRDFPSGISHHVVSERENEVIFPTVFIITWPCEHYDPDRGPA